MIASAPKDVADVNIRGIKFSNLVYQAPILFQRQQNPTITPIEKHLSRFE
jgi:hypothetical protein